MTAVLMIMFMISIATHSIMVGRGDVDVVALDGAGDFHGDHGRAGMAHFGGGIVRMSGLHGELVPVGVMVTEDGMATVDG